MTSSEQTPAAQETLRIGIVGAGAGPSWSKISHIPAILALPGVELTAVAASSAQSAREAGESLGLRETYASVPELAASRNVDLVTVCVKVPAHREMVLAVLHAGKHVLCEWPLALNVEEAEMLAAAAKQAGVHAAVGLQARTHVAARQARAAIAAGAIGKPLAAVMLVTCAAHGAETTQTYAYLADPANGATLSTIQAAHALDLAIFLLGGIEKLQAIGEIQYPSVKLTDAPGTVQQTGQQTVQRSTPDFLAVQARFTSGCVLSAAIDGARDGSHPENVPFALHVTGTRGSLTLRGGHPAGFQAGDLALEATVPLPPAEPPAAAGLEGPPVSLSEEYAALARDIRDGKASVSGFEHAVQLHRLVRSMQTAVETGASQKADGWPVD